MAEFNIQEILAAAKSIFIVLPKNSDYDKVAAGLALFLSLKQTGRQVSIASPRQMTVEFSSLVGVDKIKNKLDGRNLIISFDYIEDSIEKVSYNIEGGKFNLVIQPKEGFPSFSPDKIQYSFSGGSPDLVFVIGAESLQDLEKLYLDNPEIFDNNKKVVNINLNSAGSISEKIANTISDLKLPIDADIAGNLLAGIERATDNFSSAKTTADTFQAAALCLRAGAKRQLIEPKKKKATIPLEPMTTEVSASKPPIEAPAEEEVEPPSPDWLQPKIYKGNTRI